MISGKFFGKAVDDPFRGCYYKKEHIRRRLLPYFWRYFYHGYYDEN